MELNFSDLILLKNFPLKHFPLHPFYAPTPFGIPLHFIDFFVSLPIKASFGKSCPP